MSRIGTCFNCVTSCLEKTKIYFETVGALFLTGAAIYVSYQANNIMTGQNKLIEQQSQLLSEQAEISRVPILPAFSAERRHQLPPRAPDDPRYRGEWLEITNSGGRAFDIAPAANFYWELTTSSGANKWLEVKGVLGDHFYMLDENPTIDVYQDILFLCFDRSIDDWWSKFRPGRLKPYVYVSIDYADVLHKKRRDQFVLEPLSFNKNFMRLVDDPPHADAKIDLSKFSKRPKNETVEQEANRKGAAALVFRDAVDALDK